MHIYTLLYIYIIYIIYFYNIFFENKFKKFKICIHCIYNKDFFELKKKLCAGEKIIFMENPPTLTHEKAHILSLDKIYR